MDVLNFNFDRINKVRAENFSIEDKMDGNNSNNEEMKSYRRRADGWRSHQVR